MDISAWRCLRASEPSGLGQPNPQRAAGRLGSKGSFGLTNRACRPAATDGKLTGLQELVTLNRYWKLQ